jgi:hypothetical protein
MSRDLLREAIADAKAVRESAIANAKAALEEAFTPHLKNVLAEKIKELDEEEDMKEGYHEKKKEMEEGYHDKMEEVPLTTWKRVLMMKTKWKKATCHLP